MYLLKITSEPTQKERDLSVVRFVFLLMRMFSYPPYSETHSVNYVITLDLLQCFTLRYCHLFYDVVSYNANCIVIYFTMLSVTMRTVLSFILRCCQLQCELYCHLFYDVVSYNANCIVIYSTMLSVTMRTVLSFILRCCQLQCELYCHLFYDVVSYNANCIVIYSTMLSVTMRTVLSFILRCCQLQCELYCHLFYDVVSYNANCIKVVQFRSQSR